MAIVGDAYVLVHAKTTGVEQDIKNGFNRLGGTTSAAGKSLGSKFSEGFNQGTKNGNLFSGIAEGINAAIPGANEARAAFHDMVRTAYTLGTAFAGALGGISAAIGGITALAATAAGAIGAVVALGDAVASIGIGFGVAKLALGGVGKAITTANKQALKASGGGGGGSAGSKGTKGTAGTPGTPGVAAHVTAAQEKAYQQAVAAANQQVADSEKNLAKVIADNRDNIIQANNAVRDSQIALNDAIVQGQREIKQLGFDAEQAALDEKQAALDLNKARATLAAVQDLPPNNAARQAAELAYQEADLNLRKAKDASQQLNAQQAQLAKTGVAGTDVVISAQKNLADSQTAQSKAVVDALQAQVDAQNQLAQSQKDAADTKSAGPQVTAATAGTKGTAGTPGTAGSGGSSGGGGSGIDPFAGLNAAQKAFALFILSLKPKFDELKKIAAEGFLPPLQKAIQNLVDNAYPAVAAGVGVVAKALGAAVITISQAITAGDHMKDLAAIFVLSGKVIEDLGKIIGSLFGAVFSIMVAAAPLTLRFTGYLVDAADRFDKFLQVAQNNGSLQAFFDASGKVAAQFGDVIGNVFGILGAVIKANVGPGTGGQLLLDTLTGATQRFSDFANSVNGQHTLKTFFQDVASNALAVFRVLGDIAKAFIILAGDKSIGTAFDSLRTAIPFLQQIGKAFIDATPQAAILVGKLAEISAKLQDTGAIKVFFGTLTNIAGTIVKVLSDPALQQITITTGRFAAVLAAFGLVGKGVDFAFKAIAGSVGLASSAVGGFVKVGQGVKQVGGALALVRGGAGTAKESFDLLAKSQNGVAAAIGKVGPAFSGLGGILGKVFSSPVGIVIGIIGLLVGAFITLYKTSDTFRAGVDKIVGALSSTLGPVINSLMGAFQKFIPVLITALMPAISTILKAFLSLLPAFQPLVDVVLNQLVPAFLGLVQALLPVVATLVTQLAPVFGQLVTAVSPLVSTIGTQLAPLFSTLLDAIVPLITTIISALLPVFVLIITAISPLIKLLVAILVPVFQLLAIVIAALTPVIAFVANILVTVLVAAITFIVDLITNFSGTWGTIWDGIKTVIDVIFTAINLVIVTILTFIITYIQTSITILQVIWTAIWNAIQLVITTVWNAIKAYISTSIAIVSTVISTTTNAISSTWSSIWNGIRGVITTVWNAIKSFISTAINNVRSTISSVGGAIKSVWSGIWSSVGSVFHGIWDGIISAIQNIRNVFSSVFGGLGKVISDAFAGVLGFVKGPINGIIGLVNGAIRSLNSFHVKVPAGVPGIGGQDFGLHIAEIPQLATGGIIKPRQGGTLVNVAEAGRPERVDPLDPNGLSKRDKAMMAEFAANNASGDTNFYLYTLPGQSNSEIADMVNKELAFKNRKGGV